MPSADTDNTKLSDDTAPHGSFPFDAMSLKAGDRLQVQPPAKLYQERANVRLIGYLPDHSLLISTPVAASGARMDLIEGDELVVRVFSKQNAFGFGCNVLRACKLPYPYLHLSFPAEVQGTVIRKAPRVKTKIIAQVQGEEEGSGAMPGVISNLSSNGAQLDGRRNMAELGRHLALSFRLKLHNIEVNLSLRAIVRAIMGEEESPQGASPLAHFGLEFVDLQPNDQMVLQSMVYQQMIERPQSLV